MESWNKNDNYRPLDCFSLGGEASERKFLKGRVMMKQGGGGRWRKECCENGFSEGEVRNNACA